MNFEDSIIMTYPAMMEGLLATVPVQITYGMLLGKVRQNFTQLHAVSMSWIMTRSRGIKRTSHIQSLV